MNDELLFLKSENDKIYQTIFECQKKLNDLENLIGQDHLLEFN